MKRSYTTLELGIFMLSSALYGVSGGFMLCYHLAGGILFAFLGLLTHGVAFLAVDIRTDRGEP